jgi:hypothetical protein
MRKINTPQVDKEHYSFRNYSSERRFISYYHQVNNVMRFVEQNGAKTILIAGKGDGIVEKILQTYSDLLGLNLTITTFDFAEDLQPDIIGDLIELEKIITKKFDIILCCQVLEHIPLKESLDILSQMKRVSSFVIISVPYKAFTIRGTLKIPLLKEFEFCLKIPIWDNKSGMVDSRHYWEIGYSISLKGFIAALKSIGYTIVSSYVIKKDGFKCFFLLESG